MVNSLERLFTEIIHTLQRASQSIGDPYVRSQVFAVVDILTNLAHRVEWKCSDLKAQIADLEETCREIGGLLQKRGALPDLQRALLEADQSPEDPLPRRKDALSRLLIRAMETLTARRGEVPLDLWQEIESKIQTYLRRQLDHDLALVRPPLFRRMSRA